jgi:hypothetical protein
MRIDVDAVSGRLSGRGSARASLGLVVAGGQRTDANQRKNLVHDFQQLIRPRSIAAGQLLQGDYRQWNVGHSNLAESVRWNETEN